MADAFIKRGSPADAYRNFRQKKCERFPAAETTHTHTPLGRNPENPVQRRV